MPAEGALFAVVAVVVAVGSGLLLYATVRAEHAREDVVGRDEAERLARRDTTGDDRGG